MYSALKRNQPLNTLNNKQLRDVVNKSLIWCIQNFDKPVYGKLPTFTLSKKHPHMWFGEYKRYDFKRGHHITFYVNDCVNLLRLLSTVIHEYIHSTQKRLSIDYDRYSYIGGDWNNPFEVEARQIENKNKFKLLKYIQNYENK